MPDLPGSRDGAALVSIMLRDFLFSKPIIITDHHLSGLSVHFENDHQSTNDNALRFIVYAGQCLAHFRHHDRRCVIFIFLTCINRNIQNAK